MSRDLVLGTLALVLFGAGVWLAGVLLPARIAAESADESGLFLERRSWRRLWGPLLLPAVAIATLFGWALQEPSVTDEPLRPFVVVIAIPAALLLLRGGWRALGALRRPSVLPALATVGLLRPRIVVSAGLDALLDQDALDAALAHERAHARHHDPLRIWIAQVATDLQWPSPFARRRFDQWLSALELARDEEARVEGALGEDLAAAVVAVAGISSPPCRAIAGLTGAEASLAARVRRLLGPAPTRLLSPSIIAPLFVGLSLAIGFLIGVSHGDSFLRALPFVAS